MNAEDALRLCRMTKALMPAMQMDEYTPAAWAVAFANDRYDDAEQALKELSREQPFVGVSEIVARIKRIRSRRIEAAAHPIPPAGLTEPEERAWIGEARRRIADGEDPARFVRELGPQRPMRALMQQVGTSVPDERRADLREQLRRSRAAQKEEPTYPGAPRLREPEPRAALRPETVSTERETEEAS